MTTPTRDYTTMNKFFWGEGPWQGEPDKIQWEDEATGLPCLAVRGTHHGAWCGYVGVAEGHPWYAIGFKDPIPGQTGTVESRIATHGKIGYSARCAEGPENSSISHVPGDGDPIEVWWFGFGCILKDDLSPIEKAFALEHGANLDELNRQTYRTLDFVKERCAELAQQLAIVKRQGAAA